MTASPFIRFRHGNRLEIDSNIQKSIKDVVKGYENHGENVFRELTKDIADGSGWGIHQDSTWIRAIYELFEAYREIDSSHKKEVFDTLILVLNQLSTGKRLSDIWERVLGLISEKLEVLSGWEFSHFKRFSEERNIIRNIDGTYSSIEGKQEFLVMGAETALEEKYEYIADDILRDYGKVSLLLKLVSMVFTSIDFQKNKSHYREELNFVLPEADSNTWFLHGRWRVSSPYELIPIHWQPRTCYCDTKWLQAEVISFLAQKCKVSEDVIPEINNDEEAWSKFEVAFKDFPLQYELALDTNIQMGSEAFSETPSEVYFDFMGRKIRWINGTKYVYPILIIPSKKDGDYREEVEIARKFLSNLIFDQGTSVREIFSIARPKHFAPGIRQPRYSAELGVSDRFLQLSEGLSDKEWIALSFYKEAINSPSVYYAFLNFYKIIQMPFVDAKTGEVNSDDVDKWIDNTVPNLNVGGLQEWTSELNTQNTTPGKFMRHQGGRNAIAHVEMLRGGYAYVQPDKPEDYLKVQKAKYIIEALAQKVIKDGMLK